MAYTLDELKAWDDKIKEYVNVFKLNCYTQEFEVCDHNDMIGYMAYSGMPSHYAHWSYGKNYERQKTLYEYGVSGLPYEMVINSNPCLAYLMRDNTLLLQILTIAHVYGHNDFFANNFTFTSGSDAKYTLEMFKNNGNRIASYIEDPSIGIDLVEDALDQAHSLSLQRSKNLALIKLSNESYKQHLWETSKKTDDPHWEIHTPKKYIPPNLNKFPLQPDEDILLFVAENNPYLPEWKKDIIRIVDQQTRYFIPQMETKIMNEGWASYWHYKILQNLGIDQGLYLEFLVRHNQVLRPIPGGLNPYHLGFVIWNDIEKRWNEGNTNASVNASDGNAETSRQRDTSFSQESKNSPTAKSLSELEKENNTPGRKKIFEVRESDRDTSFLRRFLTVDIMRELELFQHEKKGKERVITKLSDDENWQDVKETLIRNVGTGSIPVIKIEDADFGKNRTLYLKHYHDGRDLLLEYAEHTLRNVKALWEREVVLETILNGKESLIRFNGENIKVDKLTK
jgi:stage V sporulation protein R